MDSFQSELLRCLDENDVYHFQQNVEERRTEFAKSD
jgi:hypothetical protein